MPAWMLAAMGGIRSILFGTRVRTAVTAGTAGLGATGLTGRLSGVPGLGFLGDDGDGRVRRRRRRRALTNSDRDDIAFIAATIGKSSAGSFAVQLVTRSR